MQSARPTPTTSSATKLYDGDGDERGKDDYDDDDYDRYFKQREEKRLKEQDKMAYKDYYGEVEKAYMSGSMPDITTPLTSGGGMLQAGLTRTQFLAVPLVIFGTTAVAAVSQRRTLFKEFLSLREVDHPLDPRTVRRPFSAEDFRKAIAQAEAAGGGGFESLPSLPRALPKSITFLTGSADALAAELASGRVVIYNFWRASSQDSLLALAALEAVAAAHPGRVTVVSMHTPKFDAERGADAAAAALARSAAAAAARGSTRQFVVHDAALELWKALGVDDWPAVVVTAPGARSGAQHAVFAALGERAAATTFAADAADALLRYLAAKPAAAAALGGSGGGAAAAAALKRVSGAEGVARGVLRDPWGIAVDAARDRLYIADSGNHRVLVCTLAGECVGVIGGGGAGLQDGRGADARFRHPRGVAIDRINQVLWVCDAGNNVVRRITLADAGLLVKTIAAGGLAGARSGDSPAVTAAAQVVDDLERVLKEEGYALEGTDALGYKRGLRAPWGVCILDSFVYVTAAGSDQVWRLNATGALMTPLAGSGRHGHRDNPGRFDAKLSDGVRFAQPMGIAAAAGALFVADADASAVRRIDFLDNSLSTQFGGDRVFPDNLFQYGDADGYGQSARFQYPTGLAAAGPGRVLLADTYNHRIKLLLTARADGAARAFAGSGERGHRDGVGAAARFNEPAGIAAAPDAGRAWVVDAGNAAVRVVDLETREVSTLRLTGVPPAARA
ncbi:hypothetical protein JKP88DRAFT_339120 [Tribonema minus]|uniref:NHL repeat-containing protein 2 n=1 Tax=Tribonema minus TaxID=303371 RepID=A0A835YIN4_9STRA|nr:hypothetical protein JKP88DRAFT_339120 [Tribonema minus]